MGLSSNHCGNGAGIKYKELKPIEIPTTISIRISNTCNHFFIEFCFNDENLCNHTPTSNWRSSSATILV